MEITTKLVFLYLAIINVITYALYAVDKSKARRNLWRIPEKILLGFALIGGTPGAYLGMKLFHHKTRKPKFYIGIPVIFMLQILAIVYIANH